MYALMLTKDILYKYLMMDNLNIAQKLEISSRQFNFPFSILNIIKISYLLLQ